jgi:hypothetical protein
MIEEFNLFCENNQLNWILDKINRYGEKSLSDAERDILNNNQNNNKHDPHYNQYICRLLTDYNNGNITEEVAKEFINEHTTKNDLFDLILQLLKDGKIDHLLDKTKNN